MNYLLINQSNIRMPRKFIQEWLHALILHLKQKKVLKKSYSEISIIFLSKSKAKSINLQYRSKNYATDVLSFSGEGEILGELVLCPEVLKKQAIEHSLSFKEEVGYMLIHGVLHLLGYDHESCKKEAEKMFAIQDKAFESLSSCFFQSKSQ